MLIFSQFFFIIYYHFARLTVKVFNVKENSQGKHKCMREKWASVCANLCNNKCVNIYFWWALSAMRYRIIISLHYRRSIFVAIDARAGVYKWCNIVFTSRVLKIEIVVQLSFVPSILPLYAVFRYFWETHVSLESIV